VKQVQLVDPLQGIGGFDPVILQSMLQQSLLCLQD
jgi:hypothetical protein